ncbi:MAG: hypothetical protein R3D02_07855 [Hyphomicrobiales bacterium]
MRKATPAGGPPPLGRLGRLGQVLGRRGLGAVMALAGLYMLAASSFIYVGADGVGHLEVGSTLLLGTA